ncbi:MAG: hypothetical protein AN485_21480 [Anabaena sp. MDT14b]|nr:MAG: hypothetical protein AN485_21480 [Anabaena sp. MDT14b]
MEEKDEENKGEDDTETETELEEDEVKSQELDKALRPCWITFTREAETAWRRRRFLTRLER